MKVMEMIGRNLHNKKNHPICILKNIIYKNFACFAKFDDLHPVVSATDNFDKLLFPKTHVSRSSKDTYYVNESTVLRTHTSAHQSDLLSKGHSHFLVTGDVYRKDTIDRLHYPVFHQMEGVCLCEKPSLNLTFILESLIIELFPECAFRRTESYFPFTDPSYEYEVKWGDDWIEVLGCGIIREEIINNCGLDGENGWAFGLGLDRLAMVLFDIPDIRILWSEDERFNQFRDGEITKFKLFSNQPSCYKDVSFWLKGEFSYNDFCELIRDSGGDVVESIMLIDLFESNGRLAHCYRINYRSVDKVMTAHEVNATHERIRQNLVAHMNVELR